MNTLLIDNRLNKKDTNEIIDDHQWNNQRIDKRTTDVDITDDIYSIANDDDAPLMLKPNDKNSKTKNQKVKGGSEENETRQKLDSEDIQQESKTKNYDDTWSIKQTFSKNNSLNNTQLGIVYNVLKHGQEDLYVLGNYNEENSKDIQSNTSTYYGVNMHNLEMETLFTHASKIIRTYGTFKDFMMSVFDYVNEGKILLIQNQYKSLVYTEIESNKTTTRATNRITDVDYILTKIKNGIIYSKPKSLEDIHRFKKLNRYALMMAYKIKHGNYSKYKCNKSITAYDSPRIKIKYNITLIPKDLQNKFNKPGRYFDEIKNVLKLDKETGFYSYYLESSKIPILCIHEYMIYEGKPLTEVSISCYRKGKCKYCGQELNAYHEQLKESLPPKIYDLIYKYMETINENIEESSLMFTLFSLIYDSIKINVDKADVKNYDASIVAFTGLYLYAVYVKTKDSIKYNMKINKFLDSIKIYWSEVGWTIETVKNVINNSTMFSNMSNMANIIKEKIYSNEITFLDLLPISILFEKNVKPTDLNKLEAKTKMQKLWLSGEDKIKAFNEAFENILLSRWQFNLIKQSIEYVSKEKINTTFDVLDIKLSKTNNGENFFSKTCEIFCPVSKFHKWNDKSVCVNCGLKKDKSNQKDVYNKYQIEITNSYLQKPCVLPDERFVIDKLYQKNQIDSYKADDLFKKYFGIDNFVLQKELNKAINSKTYSEDILKFISTVTTIDIKDLNDEPDFIKKSLAFIIDKKIKSKNEVLNELKNICFKIKNIEWLLVSGK